MSHIQPELSMLNRDDCLRLRQASLQILHKTIVAVFLSILNINDSYAISMFGQYKSPRHIRPYQL